MQESRENSYKLQESTCGHKARWWRKPHQNSALTRIWESKFPFYNLHQISFATDASKEDGVDSQTTVRGMLHAGLQKFIPSKSVPATFLFLSWDEENETSIKALCFCQSELVTPVDSAKRLHGSCSQTVNAPVLPSARLGRPLATLPCSSSSSPSCCSHQDDAKTLFQQW